MAARNTMATQIGRVRDLIGDPAGTTQVWSDDQIQGVLDEGREDVTNRSLVPKPTFSGSSIQYLDYYSGVGAGSWEDGMVLKQYETVIVTPSLIEPIVGHFQFSANVFPPVFITGKNYDIYRAAADLLERYAAQWVLRVDMVVDGQNIKRSQAADALQKLAKTFRAKQRIRSIHMVRTDLAPSTQPNKGSIVGPTGNDYMSSGSKQE